VVVRMIVIVVPRTSGKKRQSDQDARKTHPILNYIS